MNFSDFSLHERLYEGILSQKYVECTPIQESVIPPIIAGKDVAGLAQTGTGKTAAFVIPLIERILRSQQFQADLKVESEKHSSNDSTSDQVNHNISDNNVPLESSNKDLIKRSFLDWKQTNFILVLVPTRELAEQVYENIKKLGEPAGINVTAIYGGTSYDKQKEALEKGVQFLVATPGRLIDLYKEHIIDLKQVRAVVFDEADRMFDMGFKDDMKYLLRRIPVDRQMLVFSATLNFDVLNVCYEFGSEPLEVNVSKDQAKAENVEDSIFHVGHDEKPAYLLSLLKKHNPKQAIVFSNFKRNIERISKFLSQNNIPAVGISSLMTQSQRNRVMEQFKSENQDIILVATDVAARGLDVKGVDMVINFDLPDDAENYVHRIGRTGRAGSKGFAISLVSDRDIDALSRIEQYLEYKIKSLWLDDQDLVKEFNPFPKEWEMNENQKSRGPRSGSQSKNRSGSGRDENRKRHGSERPGQNKNFRKKSNNDRNDSQHNSKNFESSEKQNKSYQSSNKNKFKKHKKPRHSSNANGQTNKDSEFKAQSGYNKNKKHHHHKNKKHKSYRIDSTQQKSNEKSKGNKTLSSQKQQSLGKKVSSFFKKMFGGA